MWKTTMVYYKPWFTKRSFRSWYWLHHSSQVCSFSHSLAFFCVCFHNFSMWLKGEYAPIEWLAKYSWLIFLRLKKVCRCWIQGKSHAIRTSSCLQHSHLWRNVRNSGSSSTGLLISACPCLYVPGNKILIPLTFFCRNPLIFCRISLTFCFHFVYLFRMVTSSWLTRSLLFWISWLHLVCWLLLRWCNLCLSSNFLALIAIQVMSIFVESLCPMLQTALWKRGIKWVFLNFF